MVIARSVCKAYNGRPIVDDLEFAVRPGESLGLLGPNGAGKSTTLKMTCGLTSIDRGSIAVFGDDVARMPRAVRARIGVVPQEENLDCDLTTRENLLVQARYHGLDRFAARARADELLASAHLGARGDEPPAQLSGGMRRRLLVARALVASPSLILLDEPTNGLDPQARQTVWSMLERLRARGVALLLTTHYMEEAARLCDRVLVMDRGRAIEQGAPSELLARHEQADLDGLFLHLTGAALDA